MRFFILISVLLFSLQSQATSNAGVDNLSMSANQVLTATSPQHRVAMLELYTSEGCSSCPPADRFISMLKQAGVSNRQLIPLAFHVTYWDYIGWQDRFGNRTYDQRQRQQARLNASSTVYTPQFMINGSDYRSRRNFSRDISQVNAENAEVEIYMEVSRKTASQLEVNVHTLQNNNGDHHLWVAVYENNLHSQVSKGENEGELLRHDYVVRKLYGPYAVIDEIDQFYTSVDLDSDWKLEDLGIVAFVQSTNSSEIMQATSLMLD